MSVQIIKKIKLVNGGLNGAEITYITPEVVRNRTKYTEHVEKKRHPVPLAVEKLFKDLQPHLMAICGIEDKDKDSVIVDGVVIDYESLGIIGKKDLSFTTGKKFNISGWKIDPDDGYTGYDDMDELIKNIVQEVQMYMKGEVVVSEDEVVERWIRSGKAEVSEKEYDSWSLEDKWKLKQQLLEKSFGKYEGEEVEADEEINPNFTNEPITVGEGTTVIQLPKKGRKKADKGEATGTDQPVF